MSKKVRQGGVSTLILATVMISIGEYFRISALTGIGVALLLSISSYLLIRFRRLKRTVEKQIEKLS